MKVILLQDVAKLGKRSDVVEVPNGYATNQLIPKRMAEAATAANMKRIKKLQDEAAAIAAKDAERFKVAAEKLQAATISVAADANDQNHLFKAVSELDIVAAAEAAGIEVDAAMVVVGDPIKEVGEHEVSLVRGDDIATFTVAVVKKEQ